MRTVAVSTTPTTPSTPSTPSTPQQFDPLAEFARLLDEFPRLCCAADLLEGLEREHDAAVVRLAMIGYSFYRNTGTWTEADSTVVKDCRAAMPISVFSHAWVSFACLATGFVIGARRSGAASELEGMLAESLLPGFMMQHRGQIEGLYMAAQIKPAVSVTMFPAATPERAAPNKSEMPW